MAKKTTTVAATVTKVAEYEGNKEAPTMSVTMIPIKSIRVVPGFNVRSSSETRPDGEGAREPYSHNVATKEPGEGQGVGLIGVGLMGTNGDTLAADIKRNGLLQPVIVRPVGSGFDLVSGHRRFAAVKSIGWKSISAVVRSMTDEEAFLINLTENIQREDLSPGEIADRAIVMREKFPANYAPGEKGNSDALAKLLGCSRGYMNNLIRMATSLHPEIWALCRSGRNPNAPPHHKLHKWSLLSHEEQMNGASGFLSWLGVKADRDEEDGANEPPKGAEGATKEDDGKPKYKRPSLADLLAMEVEIDARIKVKATPELAAARAVLAYAMGRIGPSKANKDGTVSPGAPPEAPYQAAKSPKV